MSKFRDPERDREASRLALVERVLGDKLPFDYFHEGCPKCGAPSEKHFRRHCLGKQLINPQDNQCPIMGEHLHVNCGPFPGMPINPSGTCGFGWMERCRDDHEEPAA